MVMSTVRARRSITATSPSSNAKGWVEKTSSQTAGASKLLRFVPRARFRNWLPVQGEFRADKIWTGPFLNPLNLSDLEKGKIRQVLGQNRSSKIVPWGVPFSSFRPFKNHVERLSVFRIKNYVISRAAAAK